MSKSDVIQITVADPKTGEVVCTTQLSGNIKQVQYFIDTIRTTLYPGHHIKEESIADRQMELI